MVDVIWKTPTVFYNYLYRDVQEKLNTCLQLVFKERSETKLETNRIKKINTN